jgi:rhodanese-related sulfurtransferase
MQSPSTLIDAAKQRAHQLALPYQGAFLPSEAQQFLLATPSAVLIDVRTRAERDWVGSLSNAIAIEWLTYPGMQANPSFLAELHQQIKQPATLLFICRSGGRSHAAAHAATQAGYTDCFNVLEGFEGDMNAQKQRNTLNGWRVAGLSWQQS